MYHLYRKNTAESVGNDAATDRDGDFSSAKKEASATKKMEAIQSHEETNGHVTPRAMQDLMGNKKKVAIKQGDKSNEESASRLRRNKPASKPESPFASKGTRGGNSTSGMNITEKLGSRSIKTTAAGRQHPLKGTTTSPSLGTSVLEMKKPPGAAHVDTSSMISAIYPVTTVRGDGAASIPPDSLLYTSKPAAFEEQHSIWEANEDAAMMTNHANRCHAAEPKPTAPGAVAIGGETDDSDSYVYDDDLRVGDEGSLQRLREPVVAELVSNDNSSVDVEARVEARMNEIMENAVAAEVTDDREKPFDNKKVVLFLVAVFILALALAVGLGIGLTKSESADDDPEMNATSTQEMDAYRSLLWPISGEQLLDETSPQFVALNWIAFMDPANLTIGEARNDTIIARYSAAVLYFALGGAEWSSQYGFLTDNEVCSWNEGEAGGIACNSDGNVTSFNLSNNKLAGYLPQEITHFTSLRNISMSNESLVGTIPSFLSVLTDLEVLDLSFNSMSGTLPEFLFSHEKLNYICLHQNGFSGTLSSILGSSPKLGYFGAGGNRLQGTLPVSIGQSSLLRSLDLRYNVLTGNIPAFQPSSRIAGLSLRGNSFWGWLPPTIGKLSLLEHFDVADNGLHGEVPDFSGNQGTLQLLDLSGNAFSGDIAVAFTSIPPGRLSKARFHNNRMTGTIPASIGLYTALTLLELGVNNMKGRIPSEIGLLTRLQYLWINNNELGGTLPTELGSLADLLDLVIDSNTFEGRFPTEIGRCEKLQLLRASQNMLTGGIAPVIDSLPRRELSKLDFTMNSFSGTVPTSIGLFSNLLQFSAQMNSLNGTVPAELRQCEKLDLLFLGNSSLSGEFTPVIDSLPRSLKYLALWGNGFHGTIPTSIGTMARLKEWVLFDNKLAGTIPSEVGLMANLELFGVGGNSLNGTLPTEIGVLSNLQVLGICCGNSLTGSVPTALAYLPNIKTISASGTEFTEGGFGEPFCDIEFEYLIANVCGEAKVECPCCTHCCPPGIPLIEECIAL